VDKGLRERGYEVAKYRVVFFGRAEQMRTVRSEYPDLIPYLPLSATIFEAPGHTAVNTLAPAFLKQFYVKPVEQQMLDGWQKDLEGILTGFAECHKHI
jgi:hypothetical protein